MILIADSGSTKTEWCLADQGRPVRTVVTAGTNPYFQTREEIAGEIRGALLPALRVADRCHLLLWRQLPSRRRTGSWKRRLRLMSAPIEVYSDLMAAARALCREPSGNRLYVGDGIEFLSV